MKNFVGLHGWASGGECTLPLSNRLPPPSQPIMVVLSCADEWDHLCSLALLCFWLPLRHMQWLSPALPACSLPRCWVLVPSLFPPPLHHPSSPVGSLWQAGMRRGEPHVKTHLPYTLLSTQQSRQATWHLAVSHISSPGRHFSVRSPQLTKLVSPWLCAYLSPGSHSMCLHLYSLTGLCLDNVNSKQRRERDVLHWVRLRRTALSFSVKYCAS